MLLVLSFLKGASFESLEGASLESQTRKTVFLIVLASGSRHSEVHSFSGLPSAVSFSDTQVRVTLIDLPGFLAKSQAPTGSVTLVEIPSLMTHEGTFHLDRSLCPVWALKLYLEHGSVFCRSQRHMFSESGPCGYQGDPCGAHHDIGAVCGHRRLCLS